MGIAVFISGQGSNFKAIHQAIQSGRINTTLNLVVSNKPEAPGLDYARAASLPIHVIDSDETVLDACRQHAVDWLILAGYMRLVSPTILAAYPNRVINIHPSLLPKYKGLHAQKQALVAGETETGCTVHYVTPELDSGPIILQNKVPIYPSDTLDTLKNRLLPVEHETYITALTRLFS